jgi:hypothetical protein
MWLTCSGTSKDGSDNLTVVSPPHAYCKILYLKGMSYLLKQRSSFLYALKIILEGLCGLKVVSTKYTHGSCDILASNNLAAATPHIKASNGPGCDFVL